MSLSHYLHTGNGSFLLDENCLEPAGARGPRVPTAAARTPDK